MTLDRKKGADSDLLKGGPERTVPRFHLYTSTPMDFIGAYNAAFIIRRYGPTKLYSFDAHFDRVPDLTRIEPGDDQTSEAA